MSMLPPYLWWSENGGSMDLRNFGVLPQHYTASQNRRHRLQNGVWIWQGMAVAYVKELL